MQRVNFALFSSDMFKNQTSSKTWNPFLPFQLLYIFVLYWMLYPLTPKTLELVIKRSRSIQLHKNTLYIHYFLKGFTPSEDSADKFDIWQSHVANELTAADYWTHLLPVISLVIIKWRRYSIFFSKYLHQGIQLLMAFFITVHTDVSISKQLNQAPRDHRIILIPSAKIWKSIPLLHPANCLNECDWSTSTSSVEDHQRFIPSTFVTSSSRSCRKASL